VGTAHPDHHVETSAAAVLLGGPALYLLANGIFKTIVYGRFPLSHVVGLLFLAALIVPVVHTDQLMASGLATLALVITAGWEWWSRRGIGAPVVASAE
jgi:low temperature requirement protein LtrA